MSACKRLVFETASGWILVETMVALMVLSIGGVAVNRAMQDALITRAMARDLTTARFLLEQVMSELELERTLIDGASESGDFGEDYPQFVYKWNVSVVPIPQPELPPLATATLAQPVEYPVPYLGKIHVTVSWSRAGRPFERSLETLVSPDRVYTKEDEEAGYQFPKR
ncbi:MAG: hypothetical protein KJ060_10770 [Candidatus Hydrogenedentes bacterium]|nr:hypothetical protein [Candidatus Hydrogenedentota bacterium]